jgi:hypothetical protein
MHRIFFKARTPDELALFYSRNARTPATTEGDLESVKLRREFIQASLCNEDGSQLMTMAQAKKLHLTLLPQLCSMICDGSSGVDEAKKNLPTDEATSTSGTSSP